MKRFINTVTVTGADDSIDPGALVNLQQEYPFAEFALLLSRNSMGMNRFPSHDWLMEMDKIGNHYKLNLAGHFCGGWVKEFYANGEFPTDLEMDPYTLGIPFERFQFNTHGYRHLASEANVAKLLGEHFFGAQIIFQYDEINKHLLEYAKASKCGNYAALFDLSHGAGVLPSDWPKPLDGVYCGYAGGLSPYNLVENLEKIEPLMGNRRIWIDAETHLRSDMDTKFDLDKVRAFLSIASNWVI